MSITEFLLARIAEDEHQADIDIQLGRADDRALAECKAKRRIVEALAQSDNDGMRRWNIGGFESCSDSCPPYVGDWTLTVLAAVYAGHPDFNEEWR